MPSFKLTIGSTVIENDQAISIRNIRPENNISSLEFVINDYQSKSYSDLIDLFDTVKLELKCKNGSYTTTFYGEVYALQPTMSPEVLTVYCRGLEHCMTLLHCDESYGAESMNPDAIEESPRHLFQKLINEHVENSMGDAEATGWVLNESDTYIEDVHSDLSITSLTSKYQSVFTMFNRLAEIVNAYALTLGTPKPGIHWFVDPTSASPRIYLKEIGDDHGSGNWDKYYGGSQTAATIKQGVDILDYSLHQSMKDYANNVILACALRKPAYDYLNEGAVANNIWTVRDGDISLDDDSGAGNYVVGADSLKLTIDANQVDEIHYDLSNNIDTAYIGSQDTIPTISFYAMRTGNANSRVDLMLYTNRGVLGGGDQFTIMLYNTAGDKIWLPAANKWYGITIPIGPFYKNFGGMSSSRYWAVEGGADWNDIDGIMIYFNNTGYAGENYFWIDDLHISGHIIREARDASEIGTYKERQAFLRLDTAIDDSCTTADNTGTAARLAASELFKRMQFQTTAANRFFTGTVTMPMKEDLLPGQQLYVNAGKQAGGSYRFQLDMRGREVIHEVSMNGYLTRVNVTSDLWNSHTFDTPSAWGILKESAGALGHAEARDLKAAGVDIGIPRLTWDPTT